MEKTVGLVDAARQGTGAKLIVCWHMPFFTDSSHPVRHPFLRRLPAALVRVIKDLKQARKQKMLYERGERLVLLSPSFVRAYKRMCPWKNLDNLRSIPEPLAQEFAVPEPAPKIKTLLFVGRMDDVQKRNSLVIECWRRLHAAYPDWSLTLVGDGPDMGQVKEWAKDLPRVSFDGWQAPKPYYQKSPLFLMTSATEGFGMTLIEAQSQGCVPIVMDSFSALHDIVTDGENGRIVRNNDMDAFVRAVGQLMDDASQRERMAQNATTSVQRFSVEKLVPQWEALFEELIHENRP
jgi:glycosyltransferase involved in cell wall biosynthesis